MPHRELKILLALLSCWAIEQWGSVENIPTKSYITLPISATPFAVVANDTNMEHDPLILTTDVYELGKFMIDGRRIDRNDSIWAHWIAIGY